MKNTFSLIITVFSLVIANAQVGINTTTPQTTLDVISTNLDESIAPNPDNTVQTRDGVLLPRVNDLINPAIVTDSLQGVDEGQLLYVNGSGFNYWDGSTWLRLPGTSSNQTSVDVALFADRLPGVPNLYSSISGLDGEGVFTGTGRSNISIGQESFGGTADITQNANIAIGSFAGANSTIAQDNVMMIGTNAGASSTNNRSGTILIGNNAGSGSDLPGQTIAIGLNAAQGINTVNNEGGNIFIGGSAGQGSSGPLTAAENRGDNTIIGNRAALNAGFSVGSIIIGADAANEAPEIRQENLIIGNSAASSTSSRMDNYNLIIGRNAATDSNLEDSNTIIGTDAGTGINLGNNNVLLGSNTTSTAGNASSSTALGTGATITKANQTVIGGDTNREIVLNATGANNGGIRMNGSVYKNFKFGNTVDDTDYTIVLTADLTLPASNANNLGRILVLCSDGNARTVTGDLEDAVGGQDTSFNLNGTIGAACITVQAASNNRWWILARN